MEVDQSGQGQEPPVVQGLGSIYAMPSRHQPLEFKGTSDPGEAEEWIRSVERAFRLFRMKDREKIEYATSLMRKDARIWWDIIEQAHNVATMTWAEFRTLFEAEYKTADMMYAKEQEFLTLQQGEMTVKEYSTGFNSLSRFAPTMVSTQRSRMERFVCSLHPSIARDVMTGNQPPQTYSEALDRALRAEVHVKGERELMTMSNSSGMVQRGGMGGVSEKFEQRKKKEFHPKVNKKNWKGKGQQSQSSRSIEKPPVFPRCKRAHRGECLGGMNVCYRCKQPGHIAINCPRG